MDSNSIPDAEILAKAVAASLELGKPIGRKWLKESFGIGTHRAERVLAIVRAISLANASVEIPQSAGPDWATYPQIPLPALIISDLHIPYQDSAWLERVVSYAALSGIRRCVVAGDLLDAEKLSVFVTPPGESFEQSLEPARKIIQWLEGFFPEVYIFPGNHDFRFSKKLDRQMSVAYLIRLLAGERTQVYEHHHAFLGDTWLVAHPRGYSRLPTKPALELTSKFGKNVAIGHTHKLSLGTDPSGRHFAIEIGMCADARRIEYLHRELSTAPVPQLGALIIDQNEDPLLLHPRMFPK